MMNRFYKSKKVNEKCASLDSDGFNMLNSVISDEQKDVLVVIDTLNKTYYVVSEDLMGEVESQVDSSFQEKIHDLDLIDESKKQIDDSKISKEYESFDADKNRDKFAMAAMKGELSSQSQEFTWDPEELALRCYAIADAMIKIKNQKSK